MLLEASECEALMQDHCAVDTASFLRREAFKPVRTSSQVVDEALGEVARRLLAIGVAMQARYDKPVTMLHASFARLLGVTELDVRGGLAALRRYGLEVWHGRRWHAVPQKTELVERLVPVREFAPGAVRADVIEVSEEVVQLAEADLAMRARWGGRRVGAGRPRKVREAVGNDVKQSSSSPDSVLCEKSIKEEPSVLGAAAPEIRERETLGDSFGSPTPIDRLGARERIARLGVRYIPEGPANQKLFPFVRIPAPPLLDEGKRDMWVSILAGVYRGGVEARFPDIGRCHAMLRGDITKSKFFGALTKSAEFLHANRIAPAVWVLYSIDTWRNLGFTDGPPSPAWTFSASRQVDLSWFESERDRYVSGSIRYSKEALELASEHRRMWELLLRENPRDRPSLCAVVDRVFPGNTYELAVERARRAQKILQQEVDAAILKGLVLW